MDNLNKILATIFYLIWIPLGILLIAGIVFLIVANPIGSFLENLPFGGPSGSGGFGQPGGGFPSPEEIQQFQQQGGPPSGFGPPGQ